MSTQFRKRIRIVEVTTVLNSASKSEFLGEIRNIRSY